jgi:hypothetical protein
MKQLVLLALVLSGCGGSDDQDPAAPAKCEAYISAACNRMADCYVAADPTLVRADVFANCRTGARSELDCGRAIGVSSSYNNCIRELGELSCPAVLGNTPLLPKACEEAILISE